ncbi:PREDICTED: NADH dehydrogenase [ubiquinone] flavoprotein 3, mitochondrial isoform X1 [Propithecus coquereli]|uniref:NADH dehydrogenase [ubiquinone] flavoprotein 3, mitochondrial isoform X1 n=1 Tax=Propithecus coquereli TaxID=379532 RepID=UPI00063F126C|nr:PREDICTED: NADH dehydrogenase [ubiquinone] flavoprotein 3, mitochondrial isoform X1 [Propithecus coquereli]
MAASLLLRQGRAGAVKTMFLEARVFQGFASTVPLSAESGKSEKGLTPNSKKQSPPKNVVTPKEKGKLLATPAAAEVSRNVSSPHPYPSVVNKGGVGASPGPDDSTLRTHKGVPKVLSRKTLVEFPQKVPSPLKKQGSGSEARRKGQKVTDDSSSSSSSSSSSDSESDEESDVSEVGPRVVSKGKGGFRKAEVSLAFENTAPQTATSAKETTWSQKPHPDSTYPEKPRQPKKKGTAVKPSEDRKDAKPKIMAPKSQVREEFLKQGIKEKQLQNIFRSNEIDEESRKPFEGKGILPDHTKSGLSAQPAGGPAPTLGEETHLGKQVPELHGKATAPQRRKEHLGKQATGGHSKAGEEILEDQVPIRDLKTVSAEKKDVFDEKATVLSLESEVVEDPAMPVEDSAVPVEDPAMPVEDQDGTQEPAPVAAEPSDNSTYKNLQHHDYTTYTFLDLNLDLSRFRMPQPSSGRESPRH